MENSIRLSESAEVDSCQITENHTTSNSENATYLNEKHIHLLKRMFCNENEYRHHMKTLWLLRELAEKACEINGEKGIFYDTQNSVFPILKTINELVGCLLPNDGSHIDLMGNLIEH